VVEKASVIWSSAEFSSSGKPILSDVSFSFSNFEKVAVIGRVGCGKSTLLNAILKEAFVQSGKISIGGGQIQASLAE
jgi:ABC-type multidrug transport system fused ATPase/permease subunit